jgi:hypothetical protein
VAEERTVSLRRAIAKLSNESPGRGGNRLSVAESQAVLRLLRELDLRRRLEVVQGRKETLLRGVGSEGCE